MTSTEGIKECKIRDFKNYRERAKKEVIRKKRENFDTESRRWLEAFAQIQIDHPKSVAIDSYLRRLAKDMYSQEMVANYIAKTGESGIKLGKWQACYGNIVFEFELEIGMGVVNLYVNGSGRVSPEMRFSTFGRVEVDMFESPVKIEYRHKEVEESRIKSVNKTELLAGTSPFSILLNDLSPQNLQIVIGYFETDLDLPTGGELYDARLNSRRSFLHIATLGDIYFQMVNGGLTLDKIQDSVTRANQEVISGGRLTPDINNVIQFVNRKK